jgi:hypothetical protein
VWDIEGEFEYSDIYGEEGEDKNEAIGLYNVIVAVVGNKKFCLYKSELKESRYKHDARKAVEGRDTWAYQPALSLRPVRAPTRLCVPTLNIYPLTVARMKKAPEQGCG